MGLLLLGFGVTLCGAVLFYKLVERPHKIVVMKAVAAIAALAVIGNIYSGEQHAERARRVAAQYAQRFARDTAVHVEFVAPANASADTRQRTDSVRAMAFRICNFSSDTLLSVGFVPKTREAGRSTEYDVVVPRANLLEPERNPALQSDYILGSRRCVELTWHNGPFRLLDTVLVRDVTPKFGS